MENGLIFDNVEQVEHIFLYKEFEKICPYFISIGMTYEQFWYGDVQMTQAYLEAHKIKEKNEAIKTKWTIWEQGLYIYEALCDVSPILRAFSKAKKPLQYPEKPYEIDKLSMTTEDKQKEREEKEKQLEKDKVQIFFKNWARATQKHFKEKGGK